MEGAEGETGKRGCYNVWNRIRGSLGAGPLPMSFRWSFWWGC